MTSEACLDRLDLQQELKMQFLKSFWVLNTKAAAVARAVAAPQLPLPRQLTELDGPAGMAPRLQHFQPCRCPVRCLSGISDAEKHYVVIILNTGLCKME